MDADQEKAIKQALENQDLTSAVGKLQNYLTETDKVTLNIAVTGVSGSGKSSFINSFRELGDEDDGSASTGVVETTMVPEEYTHPKYPGVKLYDLPGIGTAKFKAHEYLKAVGFERYDFFIIVASIRFRECDVQLAKEIQRMKKKFYFLRNKIDVDITAEKRKKSFNEKKTLDAIRQNCIEGLRENDLEAAAVFLVSSHDLDLYDFNRLHDTIEKELPKHKKHVLLLAMPNITMEILQKKKEAMHARVWMIATLSGAVAAVPIPGLSFSVDMAILVGEIKRYQKAFNLDDKSLLKLAKRSGMPVKELKAEMKYASHKFEVEAVVHLLKTISRVLIVEGAVEAVAKYIPFVGPVVAAGLSFATTTYVLRKCLEELATDANNVLMKAANVKV